MYYMNKSHDLVSHCRLPRVLLSSWLLAVTLLPQAQGAIRLWTGNVNGNFNNSGNWSGNVIPAAGDDLVFQPNNLVARFLVTKDFSPNRAFSTITFQGSNYFVRGNSILLTNGVSAVNTIGTNH